MNSVSGPDSSAKPGRLWQIAIVTAAGVIGATSHADAAYYYWTDYSDGSYYARPDRYPEIPRQKPQKRGTASKKESIVEKEAGTKPQGPLIIVVSIDRQKVTVYDRNGVFAESPVSTGMKGHSTPMGVFSVIQKNKFHRSNLYSGAPMPYMQRITWSGVAMHAGALPGYPASHGCIRMPMSFATKMWNWTRMGARVIVAPGQISPKSFAHPLLASVRVPSQPTVSLEPQTSGDNIDKATAETRPVETKTASADSVLDLRSSVGLAVMSDVTTGNTPARDEAATPANSAEALDTAKPQSEGAVKPTDKVEPVKTGPDKSEAGAATTAGAQATAPAPAASLNAATDTTRVTDPATVSKPDAPKRAGQIAVFISRKDSKLYVRQNFAPLFEVPVTIAPSDRPLGTHVFTAEVDKADSNTLRWSVVSLPVSARSAARADDSRLARRQQGAVVMPVAAKPAIVPHSPADALDRISVPADVMAKINEMLTSGGSIIVSDQGINQGETGEGTDFIVRLY